FPLQHWKTPLHGLFSSHAASASTGATHLPLMQARPSLQFFVAQSAPTSTGTAHTPHPATTSPARSRAHEPVLHCESLRQEAPSARVPTKLHSGRSTGDAPHGTCLSFPMHPSICVLVTLVPGPLTSSSESGPASVVQAATSPNSPNKV